SRPLRCHPPPAFWRSSISSRCFFVSFFGTDSFTRARTSPRLEPLRRGAPLPFTRRRVPASVAGFTFTAHDAPVERAGLDLHRHRTVRRRHLDLRAERGLRERDRDVDNEVVAAARE